MWVTTMNHAASFKTLSKSAMQLSAQIILNTADIVCRLWPDGDVADASLRLGCGTVRERPDLRGRPMRELIHADDRPQLDTLIAETIAGRETSPLTLRHSRQVSWGTAARYSGHLAGDGQSVILIGMAVAADLTPIEQAADAEIVRSLGQHRVEAEAKYQTLFESSAEGLIVADAKTGRIDLANRNAAELLGIPLGELECASISTRILTHGPEDVVTVNQHDIVVGASADPRRNDVLSLAIRRSRSMNLEALVIRLNRHATSNKELPVLDFLRTSTSVPILMADEDGVIVWTNIAASQMFAPDRVSGLPCAATLGLSKEVFAETLREAEAHGRVLTSLGALGGVLPDGSDAQITIIGHEKFGRFEFGLLLQAPLGGAEVAETEDTAERARRLEDLIGTVSMKSVVRDRTITIERNCIDAALRLTGNNRAAAAKALGLSRQGLYSKLRQQDLI